MLSDPENIPAMINCAHGKDRTGIVTALALWCAGWSKDEIVADYAESQVQRDAPFIIITSAKEIMFYPAFVCLYICLFVYLVVTLRKK